MPPIPRKPPALASQRGRRGRARTSPEDQPQAQVGTPTQRHPATPVPRPPKRHPRPPLRHLGSGQHPRREQHSRTGHCSRAKHRSGANSTAGAGIPRSLRILRSARKSAVGQDVRKTRGATSFAQPVVPDAPSQSEPEPSSLSPLNALPSAQPRSPSSTTRICPYPPGAMRSPPRSAPTRSSSCPVKPARARRPSCRRSASNSAEASPG